LIRRLELRGALDLRLLTASDISADFLGMALDRLTGYGEAGQQFQLVPTVQIRAAGLAQTGKDDLQHRLYLGRFLSGWLRPFFSCPPKLSCPAPLAVSMCTPNRNQR
jgi:hypothetical protein